MLEPECIVCGEVFRAGEQRIRLAYLWEFCQRCVPSSEELIAVCQHIIWSRSEVRPCEGITRKGEPCHGWSLPGLLYCRSHVSRNVKAKFYSLCQGQTGHRTLCGCYAVAGTNFCKFHTPGHEKPTVVQTRQWRQAYHAKVERKRQHPE